MAAAGLLGGAPPGSFFSRVRWRGTGDGLPRQKDVRVLAEGDAVAGGRDGTGRDGAAPRVFTYTVE